MWKIVQVKIVNHLKKKSGGEERENNKEKHQWCRVGLCAVPHECLVTGPHECLATRLHE